MTIYSVAYSVLALLKFATHNTFAWDLGIYNQTMYSLTTHGDFYYTAELYINPSGNYLAQHFGLDLLLLVPIYILFPSPTTLLAVQTIAIALGANAIWLLARDYDLSPRTAGFLGAAYLVYPPVLGVNWYDFHLEAFFMVGMLYSVHFWRRGNWRLFWVSLVFSLFTLESTAAFVAFFGVTTMLIDSNEVVSFLRRPSLSKIRGLTPIAVLVVSAVFFLVVRSYQRVLNPVIPEEFQELYLASANWSILGISDPLNPLRFAQALVLRPGNALAALMYDWPAKALYLSFFVVPLFGLPLLRTRWLLPGLPWLFGLLFSNYPPYYVLGFQYSAFLVPWFFVAAIEAFPHGPLSAPSVLGKRFLGIRPFLHHHVTPRRLLLTGLVYFTLATMVMAAIPDTFRAAGIPPGFQPYLANVRIVPSGQDRGIDALIALVPPDASIVTQSNLFPQLSGRRNAYVIPYYSPERAWNYVTLHAPNPIEFVLFDSGSDPAAAAFIYDFIIRGSQYGLFAIAGTAQLYLWDYSGPVRIVPVDMDG